MDFSCQLFSLSFIMKMGVRLWIFKEYVCMYVCMSICMYVEHVYICVSVCAHCVGLCSCANVMECRRRQPASSTISWCLCYWGGLSLSLDLGLLSLLSQKPSILCSALPGARVTDVGMPGCWDASKKGCFLLGCWGLSSGPRDCWVHTLKYWPNPLALYFRSLQQWVKTMVPRKWTLKFKVSPASGKDQDTYVCSSWRIFGSTMKRCSVIGCFYVFWWGSVCWRFSRRLR